MAGQTARKGIKSTSVVAALTAGLLLAFASFAWACTGSGHIQGSLVQGPARSQVVIEGSGFASGAPVEIRWNSPTGEIVGTATGPTFSVPVTVPAKASPDVYYIVAVQRELNASQLAHGATGRASATFEVTEGRAETASHPSRTAVENDLWAGFDSGQSLRGSESIATTSADSPNRAALAVGGVLLATGLTALMATILVATRRRAPQSRNRNNDL